MEMVNLFIAASLSYLFILNVRIHVNERQPAARSHAATLKTGGLCIISETGGGNGPRMADPA
jgi:hypothetical protein